MPRTEQGSELHGGVGHKLMTKGAEFRLPLDAQPFDGADFNHQGGLITQNGRITHFAKGPFWRPQKNEPVIREKDVSPLFRREKENGPVGLKEIDVGGELEIFFWDGSEAYPVMAKNSPLVQKLQEYNNNGANENGGAIHFIGESDYSGTWPDEIAYSPELCLSVLEVNHEHKTDAEKRGQRQLKTLQIITEEAEKLGVYAAPISAFSHRPLEKKDTHPDPYVQRIAMEFMGWENVRFFVGNSYQVHCEMITLESALAATNYFQQITPIIHALTLAGPFLDGQVYLSGKNLPGIGEAPTQWQSVRYLTRVVGSPSGGVMKQPLPEKESDFWELASDLLKNGEIPSPARTPGHHRDFRVRPDIPPYGTIEIAFMDTAGADPLRMLALQELLRVCSWKLQRTVLENREDELPKSLFKQLEEKRLQEIHQASISVSKDGIDAQMIGANGKVYSTQELWQRLADWVNEPVPEWGYHGLPSGILESLNNSAQVVSKETLDKFQDKEGHTSVYGFYKTGKGTLSQWLLKRARQLLDSGLSEKDAVTDCLNDLGRSYHYYLKEIGPQDITNMLA